MSQLTEFQQNELQSNGMMAEMNPMMAAGGVDIWGIVSRRKWLLIFGLILGSALGYIYLLNADPVYESTGRILVETKKPVLPGFEAFGTVDVRGESKHAIIITSPQLLFDAYTVGKLEELPTFKSLPDDSERMKFLSNSLSVIPADEEGNVLDISFRCGNSTDTQKVVEGVVLSYKTFLDKTYKDDSQVSVNLLVAERNRLEEQLEQLTTDYRAFQDTAPTLLHDEHGESISLAEKHQQDHDRQRIQIRHQIADISAELIAIQEALSKDEPNFESVLISTSAYSQQSAMAMNEARREQLISQRLIPLQLQHEQLTSQYGPNHPEVKVVAAQLARFNELYPDLQSDSIVRRSNDELKESIKALVGSLEKQKAKLESEAAQLDELYTQAEAEAKRLAKAKEQDRHFREEIARNRETHAKMIDGLTQLGLAKHDSYQGYKYSQLGPPTMGQKVAPMPLKILPISGMLGVMCGFGLAYLIDISDKAFRTPDEVSQVMRLPVVGHIPLIEVAKVKTLPGSEITPVIVTVHKPKSPQAEAYRAVRTALYFNTRDQTHKVIQVTSPMPGDGKSTLAANLAVTIAQSGKSVLLMDADFRRPTLHKVFGLEKREEGLAPFVVGAVDLDDAIQTLPETPNLSLLPCGTRPSNPSELLSSQEFANCLELFKEKFDFVIVDTPPVLAVSDGCAVAARVDGVILTFRIHKRAKPLATRARDALNNIGANVFGLVVNGVDQDAGGYYSQYRYGYSGYRYAYNYKYGYGYGQYGTYGSEAAESKAINQYFDEDITDSSGRDLSSSQLKAADDQL
ncbi:MAG: polysaccharide biosynthesis tyrosine autokinase [Planctomycetales bacterium]|nr:polysaccharide biosynthesis tyrosine autokinase [Planctomycetales bacterium]